MKKHGTTLNTIKSVDQFKVYDPDLRLIWLQILIIGLNNIVIDVFTLLLSGRCLENLLHKGHAFTANLSMWLYFGHGTGQDTIHIIKRGLDPMMDWPGSREKHIRIMLVPTVNF